jgi:hypothetical protein
MTRQFNRIESRYIYDCICLPSPGQYFKLKQPARYWAYFNTRQLQSLLVVVNLSFVRTLFLFLRYYAVICYYFKFRQSVMMKQHARLCRCVDKIIAYGTCMHLISQQIIYTNFSLLSKNKSRFMKSPVCLSLCLCVCLCVPSPNNV